MISPVCNSISFWIHARANVWVARRSPFTLLIPLTLLFAFVLTASAGAGDSEDCPRAAHGAVEDGWAEYRAGNIPGAFALFEGALSVCPDHVGAGVGMGYACLRLDRREEAKAYFERALELDRDLVDAWAGLALTNWRLEDLTATELACRRALELDPGHAEAGALLQRLPRPVVRAERPPLVLPDSLDYPSRTFGDRFEIRGPDGWEPFYLKGINLGAALPGRHPSQFPDSTVYSVWLDQMRDMGVNSIRVYTIHPPHFYEAVRTHNVTHPDRPLWLVHGVWTGLPPHDDYSDAEFEKQFFDEMEDVVDLLHGRATIAHRPGHSSGDYLADVSPWVLAYIIGREWEPFSVVGYEEAGTGSSTWDGQYIDVAGGTSLDAWMGKACEYITAYETETYRSQRPVAYTNWPTLDPMHHPTESTVEEEIEIRRGLGESVENAPREYDNDATGLTAGLMKPTDKLPAGVFAAFHAYPYYPDFMILDPEYGRTHSSEGRSNYFAYLRHLKELHPKMPVVIAEYGVPTSLGIAHFQPQGWHHGGLSETAMAEIDARLTREIAEAGMAGGMVFAWIDEWFKKNWIVVEFEQPFERNRLWLNRLDAEQHYGMIAMEPGRALPGSTLVDRRSAWNEIDPLFASPSAPGSIRLAVDEAYLRVLIDPGGDTTSVEAPQEFFLGFDTVAPEAGDRRWPGRVGKPLPVGLEHVLHVRMEDSGGGVRIVSDPASNLFRVEQVRSHLPDIDAQKPLELPSDIPGAFLARAQLRFNWPYVSEPNEDGVYDPLRVVTNRPRFARDGTEFLGAGYDRGLLQEGVSPDGSWERTEDGLIEVRVPWMLLGFTDPSERRVIQGGPGSETFETGIPTRLVEDIRILAAARFDDKWTSWPESEPVVRSFTWPTWDEPTWSARVRPVFGVMRDTYAALDPLVARDAIVSLPPLKLSDPLEPVYSSQAEESPLAESDPVSASFENRPIEDPEQWARLHETALALSWDGLYEQSLARFDSLLAAQPENKVALVDRARVQAWSGDTPGAVAALDQLLQGDLPESIEFDILRARSQFAAWDGDLKSALTDHERLSELAPGDRDLELERAKLLVWSADFVPAEEIYRSLLSEDPEDADALVGVARLLTWSERFDEAIALYEDFLARRPDDLEALRGMARAHAWNGQLRQAEEYWDEALAIDGDDVESLVGLAQTLRWQGRQVEALEPLSRAATLSPGRKDVRTQMAWALSSVQPRLYSFYGSESDSDDNDVRTITLKGKWNPHPQIQLHAALQQKTAAVEAQSRIESQLRGFDFGAEFHLSPGWKIGADFGEDETGPGGLDRANLHFSSPERSLFGGSVRIAKGRLSSTSLLIRNPVATSDLGTDLRLNMMGFRWRAGLSRTRFRGDETNYRRAVYLGVSRRWSFGAETGLSYRTFSFESDLHEGYWDPSRYGILEFPLRWPLEGDRGSVTLSLTPGLERQGRGATSSGSLRGQLETIYRFSPGREWSLGWGYASTGVDALGDVAGSYTYRSFTSSLSWVF